jgi:glycosyltransferase 2 family protein
LAGRLAFGGSLVIVTRQSGEGGTLRKLAVMSAFLCLALLAALIWATGATQLLDALKKVPPGHVLAALAAVQMQIVASAWRWRFTARRLGQEMPLSVAIREYYVSSALNLVLPGGMAGDAVRAYRNRAEGEGGWKRPAAAVFLERLSGQLVFFALVCGGLIAWPLFLGGQLPGNFGVVIWIAAALVIAGLGLGIALRNAWLPARFRGLGPDLAAVFWKDGAWLVQAGLGVLIVGGYIATFMIASDAVGAPLPAIAAFTVIPLCLLTMLIPAGIGGWGTRETAAAALWPLFGYANVDGLAASLVYGLLSLVGAAVPGLISVAVSLWQGRIGKA